MDLRCTDQSSTRCSIAQTRTLAGVMPRNSGAASNLAKGVPKRTFRCHSTASMESPCGNTHGTWRRKPGAGSRALRLTMNYSIVTRAWQMRPVPGRLTKRNGVAARRTRVASPSTTAMRTTPTGRTHGVQRRRSGVGTTNRKATSSRTSARRTSTIGQRSGPVRKRTGVVTMSTWVAATATTARPASRVGRRSGAPHGSTSVVRPKARPAMTAQLASPTGKGDGRPARRCSAARRRRRAATAASPWMRCLIGPRATARIAAMNTTWRATTALEMSRSSMPW
mmetsp:Transcript_48933/g.114263  ORF Transcript_48933/g.114263 Transcript_48933/m.114263 type:complete len:281 (-) Transcript_48933:488-1330(-)